MGNGIPEVPTHCFVLLRTLGRIFGREKNIFGFRVFNYTYWALVRAPGRVWWDGLQRMGLDDAVPIGKVLPFWDVRAALGSGLLLGAVFHRKKKSISSYNVFTFIPVFSGYLGSRNGWMDWDYLPKWAWLFIFLILCFLTWEST